MQRTMLVVLAMAWLGAACGGEEEAAPEIGDAVETDSTDTETAEEGGGETGAAIEAEAGPVAEDPTFELRATASGPYAAGEEGTFQIQLTPRGRYHVNQDFPMNIALDGPDGVALPAEDLGNAQAAEFTEETARFEVPFTPSAAGEHRVTAEVDFAVCTPEACMPDRRTLALVLPVN